MKIDIEHIAKLSKLKISDDKKEKFASDMENIINMIESLPQTVDADTSLDTSCVMELREDSLKPDEEKFSREELLKNAPQIQAGCFVVPKVVE